MLTLREIIRRWRRYREDDVQGGVHPLAPVAFACGIGALVVGGMGGIVSENPPSFHGSWILSWLASAGAILVSLIACGMRRNLVTRLVASISIVFALLGAYCPTESYYGNYHDYPWLVFAGFTLLVGIGFLVRLRAVPIGFLALLALWFYAAALPPNEEGSITRRADGLELTLLPDSYTFRLRDMSGRDLSQSVDLENGEMDCHIGPFIDVDSWPLMVIPVRMPGDKPIHSSNVTLAGQVFAPNWARSFDLTVTLRRWPRVPAAEVVIDLRHLPATTLVASTERYKLEVSGIEWGRTQSSYPPTRCLHATIAYSGLTSPGYRNTDFRVVDDLGNVTSASSTSGGGTDTGEIEFVEIVPADPRARLLRVQLMDEDPGRMSVFRFPRIAPR